jgi:hypothetical protein
MEGKKCECSMVYGLWSMVYGLWSMVYGLCGIRNTHHYLELSLRMRGAIRLFPLYDFVARVGTTFNFFVKEANKSGEDNFASC